jgi:hypothetical protein
MHRKLEFFAHPLCRKLVFFRTPVAVGALFGFSRFFLLLACCYQEARIVATRPFWR